MSQYKSKPGKHGTLYLWKIDYTDVAGSESDFVGTWKTWAYNNEHAWDNWHESNEEMGFGTRGDFQRVTER